ncbi:hypothetical protein [Xylella fastidiosa]|nr:hypothetical protein [Xylella fastidiosa]
MPAIEAAGYSIVLTVHDEIITEADDNAAFKPRTWPHSWPHRHPGHRGCP